MKKHYRLLLPLILCLPASTLSAQTEVIKPSAKTVEDLSSRQAANYYLLKERKMHKAIYLVEAGRIPGILESNHIALDLPFLPCRNIRYILTGADSTATDSTAMPDTYVWSGLSQPDPSKHSTCTYGEMTLVNHRGVFAGAFTIDGYSYELADLGEGVQAVAELDPGSERLRTGSCGTASRPSQPPPTGPAPADCDQIKTKVLVLYTDKAIEAAVGILPGTSMAPLAHLGIAQLNATLANSGINHRVSLAAVKPLSDFVEGDNISSDINALASHSYVRSLRDQYKAELVVLLTGPEYGSAYGVAKDVGGTKEEAYAIVDITTATTSRYTFAHEIGHLYGGRHDSDPDPGTAHGYVFNAGNNQLYTLMAEVYNEGRIQYFSNPDVYVQGQPSGTAGYYNNAGKVSSMVGYIAGFYADPGVLTVSATRSGPAPCLQSGTATATASCGYGGYTYKWYAGQYTANGSTGSWAYIGSGPTVNTFVPSSPTGFNSRPYKVIVTDGLGRVAIRHIFPTYSCYGNGIYWPASGGSISPAARSAFRLYPNPAHGSLSIALDVPEAGNAGITLLDISGKKLRTLHEGELMRGTNNLSVDISGFAKGMYFIRLQSPGYNKTEKLIIQ